jgi:ubiquinone biosynthesis protein
MTAAIAEYGARRLAAGRLPRAERDRLRGRVLSRMLERLGATFVKFGQILSSRPDLLPTGIIEGLAKLQDDVPPVRFEEVEAVLEAELKPAARAKIARVDPVPVAAASVAQVHRAELTDGRGVALKVQRPKARMQIEQDLILLGVFASLLDRLPSLYLLSLPGAVERFAAAMEAQLDFTLEAANNRRFAAVFAHVDGISVPWLVDELCTRRVLTMELIEGVPATMAERVGGDRMRLAQLGVDAVLRMIFVDGFVHADMHPGNMMITTRGDLVLIDLGLVAEVPPPMMRPFCETFLALAQRDGREASRLFYVHAPSVGTRSYAAFEQDIVAFFDALYGKSLGDVEVSGVIGGAMDILRRHRIQVDPVFTVVNIALLVAEGVGKQLDPKLDVVSLAAPYLMRAVVTAPPGRAALRTVPA